MKKLLFLIFLLILPLSFSQKTYAKVWTRDLVDKVTLTSGYKFSLCSIDMNYDSSAVSNSFLVDVEKEFEANTSNFPCNKESGLDMLFANITLNFTPKWNAGSAPQKLIALQDGLYSVDEEGYVLTDPTGLNGARDISGLDWFSNIPGIRAIRGGRLINTDPKATYDPNGLPNTSFVIFHDAETGKFNTALFVINGKVYKINQIISQVTVGATLVDYTNPSSAPSATLSPTPVSSPSPTPQVQNLSITGIDPGYIPEMYYELNRTHFTVTGNGFQSGAKVFLEGPYMLQGDPDRFEPDPNSSIVTYELQNVRYISGEQLEGDLPSGLPNAYFKAKVINPNGSSAYTPNTMGILRGGDPNER